jgi:rtcB protein, putative
MAQLTLQGKYNTATVYTYNIEETAIGQVIGMLNEVITENTTVAIMPDVHAGKGSTIGTTIKLPHNKKRLESLP